VFSEDFEDFLDCFLIELGIIQFSCRVWFGSDYNIIHINTGVTDVDDKNIIYHGLEGGQGVD